MTDGVFRWYYATVECYQCGHEEDGNLFVGGLIVEGPFEHGICPWCESKNVGEK